MNPLPAMLALLLGIPAARAADATTAPDRPSPLSPTALAATRDGQTLFVACATGQRVLRVDLAQRAVVASLPTPAPPTGLALSPDDRVLAVTCAAPESPICLFEVASNRTNLVLMAGHTAMAPVFSRDGQRLYVCNRFQDQVVAFDLTAQTVSARWPVPREPVAAALTPDGRRLLVANLLHNGRANTAEARAVVSVLDLATPGARKDLALPIGSGSLLGLAMSPDGRHAVVTHILSRFAMPATQLDRGWMNTNAKTLIDLESLEVLNTVLLDSVDRGAANPWGAAFSADGAHLVIAHAGTHELSVIRFPALLERLRQLPATPDPSMPASEAFGARTPAEVPNDLSFLVGLRQRVPFPAEDRGPRALIVVGNTAIAANYFSDSLALLDLTRPDVAPTRLALGPTVKPTLERLGESYFHDANLCFQGWQSCATCHPGEGRVDALNWDLLNDGVGNLKNNKSLLLSHRTPPAMSLGVRETAETAVRAGIRHILFSVQPEAVAEAMDAYLKALEPVPSPHLVAGRLSPAAQRGQRVFQTAGCAECHPPGLFTDRKHYDVGSAGPWDGAEVEFDTPTLVESWRTAPYLHDGSAARLQELFTDRNRQDQHGQTSKLTPAELDDLCLYVLSL